MSWLREEQADLAVEKILVAAGDVFACLGVARAGMADIAQGAGCSRGTLYRYFPNRNALLRAYVNRMAVELSERVAKSLDTIDDPRERLVQSIVRSLREVRTTPATAAWFEPGDSGIAAGISARSEVIEALAGAFVTRVLGREADEGRLSARWLVRVIVSLLTTPGESEAEERELIERFVAPVLLSEAG